MSGPILLLAASECPSRLWLEEAGFRIADEAAEAALAVFAPDREAAARALSPLPRVACLPVDLEASPDRIRAPGACELSAVRADAYCSDRETLLDAVRFALSERRDERLRGPLRLTWLGALGELRPPQFPPIGASYPIAQSLSIGRSYDAQVCLRQGAHSDQNTVARRHALIERSTSGARVRDLGSTNGTWFAGKRVEEAELRPGDELAIAATQRLRLDGEP